VRPNLVRIDRDDDVADLRSLVADLVADVLRDVLVRGDDRGQLGEDDVLEIEPRESGLVVHLRDGASADEAAGRVPDLEVREEVVLLSAAQARDRAIELADAGRLEDARSLLDQNVEGLRRMGCDGEASALAADLGRLDSYDLMLRKKLRYDSIRRRGKQF
jgi:hypothetical protein